VALLKVRVLLELLLIKFVLAEVFVSVLATVERDARYNGLSWGLGGSFYGSKAVSVSDYRC
jgi:hypothetical protein